MMSRLLLSLALASLLAGCGPYRHDKPAPSASAGSVVEPKRSRRGNPPFYEVMGQRYYVSASSDGIRIRITSTPFSVVLSISMWSPLARDPLQQVQEVRSAFTARVRHVVHHAADDLQPEAAFRVFERHGRAVP